MSYDSLTDDMIIKRTRHLSDKLNTIKSQIEPLILEFEEIQKELLPLLSELEKRGIVDVT